MRSMILVIGICIYTLAVVAQPASAQTVPSQPAPAQPHSAPQAPQQQIAVYPPDINLETARDRQSFVVQLTQPDGITRDVTAQAQVAFANPALVRHDKDKFTVYPVADGTTEMTVVFNGQTVKVPVKVVKAKEDRVVPVEEFVHRHRLRRGHGGVQLASRELQPLMDLASECLAAGSLPLRVTASLEDLFH